MVGVSRGVRRAWLVVINTLVLLVALVAPAGAQNAPTAPPEPADKVDAAVLERIDAVGEATFWVRLSDKADLSGAENIQDWAGRGRFVYDALVENARDSQASVIAKLDDLGVEYTTYWVSNAIRVTGDAETVEVLAEDPKVDAIVPPFKFDIPEPIEGTAEDTIDAIEWGIDRINANDVWSEFGVRGEGVVVANIDSGVQFDHPALVAQYRGNNGDGTFDHNYNWHDPSQICGNPSAPCDNNGHGTHTMGTMVGDDGGSNQIGVAPGARWLAAKGCETNSCSDTALLSSAQFVLAPTDLNGANPRPDLRPNVVNNSWGGGFGDPWYLDMVTAWIASGIFPQFSNGNAGPSCGTASSPGDYLESYAAGAFDINDNIAGFSSRGPSAFDGEIKPNIAAPGVNVRSSFPGDAYGAISGTSMASPHVAGTVALMWSAAPSLNGDIDGTRALLDQTAHDTEDLQCGGTAADNNVWGEGILDALLAVEQSPRGDTGTLEGTVTDATTGDPIAGALVTVTGPIDRTVTTDDNGFYTVLLIAGTYEVSVNAYGYAVETASAEITAGATTTLDFALDPLPSTVVTGTVTDGSGHGWPLYARIDIDGYPGGPVFTDPLTGEYSVELVASTTYTFNVSAVSPGYAIESREVAVPPDSATQDFALEVDAAACVAPGYEFLGFTGETETFDEPTVPEGWTVVDNVGNGQMWRFDDPGGRGNLTGGEGGFAVMDSDFFGPDGQQDTELISPIIDLSGADDPVITFNTDYLSLSDTVDVDISIDGGATWTNVWRRTADLRGPAFEVINIPAAAGESDVQVRFHHYNAFWAWWWEVDNVMVGDAECAPVEGGLVVGNVYDLITGEPLNGATVTVDEAAENSATTQATPDDPAVDDGFYILFSPLTGPTDITADKAQYGPSTETVDVVADAVVEQDFELGSGNLVVDPDSLEAEVPMGSTADLNMTITNDGTATTEFEITERDRGREILGFDGTFSAPAEIGELSVRSLKPGPAGDGAGINEPPWLESSPLPGGLVRYAHAQCEDNGATSYYVFAGVDGTFSITDASWRYDADTDTWTELAPVPEGGEGPTAACLEGKIHVMGGDGTDRHYVYDVATDTWTAAAPLPRPVWGAAAAASDGTIVLAGGDSDFFFGGTSNEVNIYDAASDTWTTGAPMPAAASTPGFAQAGELLFVVGGWGDNAPASNVDVTQRYDISGDAWETGSTFESARADLALSATDTAIYAAGGDADGGGPFDSSAMVERLDVSGWPAGAWEEVDSLPEAMTANNAGACTDAVAGGEIWSVGGIDPTFTSDGRTFYRSTSGEGCALGGVDVPWLSEDPVSGILEPEESVDVTVTLDASVPEVDQPGAYRAELRISEDTPQTVPPVPVTMNVTPPDNWGKVTGTVFGLLRCDEPGSPLAGATVQIGDFVVETDGDGVYEWWLEEGTYPITVTIDGYVTQTGEVTVTAGETTTADFTLRLDAPCADVTPDSLEAELPLGSSTDLGLTVTNTGAAVYEFEIGERDRGREILGQRGAPVSRISGTFSPLSAAAAPKAARAPVAAPERSVQEPPWTDIADYPTAIMDSTADAFDGLVYSVGGFDGGNNVADANVYDPDSDSWSPIASMGFEREKPAAAFVDGLLYVVGGWDNAGGTVPALEIYDPATDTWSMGADVPTAYAAGTAVALDGQLYVIGGCQGGCGSTDVFVYDPAGDTWSQAAPYPELTSWAHCGVIGGSIYCAGGVSDASGESSNGYVYDAGSDSWSSIADLPQTQWGGGYVAANDLLLVSGGVTDNFATVTNEGFAYDPATDAWTPIPNSNNVVYRGASACGFYKIGGSIGGFSPIANSELLPEFDVCGAPSDVPWLSEDPTSGSVAEGESLDITVTLDASVPEVDQPGAYLADLVFRGNDTVPAVPVTMNVTPPDNWGKVTGTVFGLLRCDEPGSPLAGATVQIGDFVVETDGDGVYEWWLEEGTYPITVTIDGYVTQTGEVTVTAGETTTADFTLRLDAPCADVTPESLEFTVPEGGTDSAELTLTNTGAGAFQFVIDETPFPLGRQDPPAATADASFSAPAEIGELSVRSLESRGAPDRAAIDAPPWFGAADLPGGLVRYAHAQCDGNTTSTYVFAGVDGTFNVTDASWRFDADSNTWNELAPIPEGGEGPTAVCNAGRIHVLGGDGTDRHYVYDIGNDSWSTAAPVPRPVWGASAGAFDGKIYLIGGDPDFFFGGTSDEVSVYDPATDSWSEGAAMPVAATTPGNAQSAQYVYVVGGWGDGSPDVNVDATQRYDMSTNTWETGPVFESARADFALSATRGAIYAAGGDADGGGPFDSTNVVERLGVGGWPGAGWTAIDSLPKAVTANNAGACTEAIFGGEVWSISGIDLNFVNDGRTFFRSTPEETCASIREDVPWLSVDPTEGEVPGDSSTTVTVTVDASGLDQGTYEATLIITTTDPGAPEFLVPVTLTVEGEAEPEVTAWIAVENNGTVGDLTVTRQDIVAVNSDGSVELAFDGSEAGLPGNALIDGFAHTDDTLLFSFRNPTSVPGISGGVDDSDIVIYQGGVWSLWFDGSDVDLTGNGEDVDAVEVLADGTILVSTEGQATASGIRVQPEDMLAFTPESLGDDTVGTWAFHFDGSDVGLSGSNENVDAAAVDAAGSIALSTRGALSVPGLTAADDDVAVFVPTSLGPDTAGSFSLDLLLDGSDLGLDANDITAVEVPD